MHEQVQEHSDCLLRDERDGTFTVVDFQDDGSATPNVPLVVSTVRPGPIPQNSTHTSTSSAPAVGQQKPASASGLPELAREPLRDTPAYGSPSTKLSGTRQPMHDTLPVMSAQALTMWDYLLSMLCQHSGSARPKLERYYSGALQSILQSEESSRLLGLPRQREFQWVGKASMGWQGVAARYPYW